MLLLAILAMMMEQPLQASLQVPDAHGHPCLETCRTTHNEAVTSAFRRGLAYCLRKDLSQHVWIAARGFCHTHWYPGAWRMDWGVRCQSWWVARSRCISLQWLLLLSRALVSLGVRLSVYPRRETGGDAEQLERRLRWNATTAQSIQLRMHCAAMLQLMTTENYICSFGFGFNPKSVICTLYMWV